MKLKYDMKQKINPVCTDRKCWGQMKMRSDFELRVGSMLGATKSTPL